MQFDGVDVVERGDHGVTQAEVDEFQGGQLVPAESHGEGRGWNGLLQFGLPVDILHHVDGRHGLNFWGEYFLVNAPD